MSITTSQLDPAATLSGSEIVEVSQLSTTIKKTATTISINATAGTVNDSASGFLAAGFGVGDRVNISGFSTSGNNVFTAYVATATAGALALSLPPGVTLTTQAAGNTVTIAKWYSRRTSLPSGAGIVLTGYSETEVGPVDASSGVASIDYSAGNIQRVTIGDGVDTTLTFSNLPVNKSCSATLLLEMAGAVPTAITLQGITVDTTDVTASGEIIVEAIRIASSWYMGVHHAS